MYHLIQKLPSYIPIGRETIFFIPSYFPPVHKGVIIFTLIVQSIMAPSSVYAFSPLGTNTRKRKEYPVSFGDRMQLD